MPSDLAVVARDVSKKFRLYHERPHSLKERFVMRRGARYEEFNALRNVSCEIRHGESFGIIGANGCGKTTFLKCIAGILRPEEGHIATWGRLASLLELGAGFHPDLTGRENVYLNASILGLTKKQTDRRFDEMVAFAELEQFIDTQVKHYSSGMYVRLGFAVAVHSDPEVLLVDEVLAVGDERFQRKCLDRIADFQRDGRTIVLVTHSMEMLRNVCNRAMFIDHGEVVIEGRPGEVIRMFRDTLHGESHTEASTGEERGNRQIRILRVAITDGLGHEKEVFRAGDELVISIDLDAPEPVSDPMVGIAVYDEKDDLVLGTNSDSLGHSLGVLHGKTRVRFSCGDLPMQDGRYLVTIGVTTRDHRTVYHWQEKAYPFACERTGLADGRLVIPVGMEVEPL
jgi:ABC-2 type transport system ATP-binding protein